MTAALLIDLWFTLTGVAALVMTAAQLFVTVVQLSGRRARAREDQNLKLTPSVRPSTL